MAAIDPSMAASGAEWNVGSIGSIGSVDPAGTQGGTSGASFGSLLGQSLQSLQNTQDQAAGAANALATGQASDPSSVVMAVERAQLAMQLASQIRTKAVEAAQDIFHTTV
ncbi:MAG TPA: flagellar hook-basal body complex protein FliE [Solirubrobacteraceae bacterium]|nr:flagellar hook-basal body complex protein FliE [Solirubrobacteraceae bacterium]